MSIALELKLVGDDDIWARDLRTQPTQPAWLEGFICHDGLGRIRPRFMQAGLRRLSMNAAIGPDGLLAYSPTLDNDYSEDAGDDSGQCHSPAEIVDGWAVLEPDTFATVTGYIVTAGSGPRDYVDSRIYGSEVEALRQAAIARGKYGVVEVKTITVSVEVQDGRLAFYGPIIGEL